MIKSMDEKTRRELEEYIAAREKVAFAQGWAACLTEKMGLGSADTGPALEHIPSAAGTGTYAPMKQLPRGVPKMLVAEFMSALGARHVSQIEIIREIKAEKGVRLTSSSVARALLALSDKKGKQKKSGKRTRGGASQNLGLSHKNGAEAIRAVKYPGCIGP